jgi:hypothetical protein
VSTVEHPRRRARPSERVAVPGDGCAELELVVVEGEVLYWPDCGHALDDDTVLYDRPVCIVCDPG